MRLPRFAALFAGLWLPATLAFPGIATQPPAASAQPALATASVAPTNAAPTSLTEAMPLTGGLPSGSDITAAALAATARSQAQRLPLSLAVGTFYVSKPLVITEDLRGAGVRSVLVARGLTTGAAILTVRQRTDGNAHPAVGGLRLVGDCERSLGVRTPGCDGLRAETGCLVTGVRCDHCGAGVVDAANHVYLRDCKLTDDFYGLYSAVSQGDLRVTDCELDGNTFASVGMAATGGIHSSSFAGCHFGFSPYGFYQEAGSPGYSVPFLSDVAFTDCAFEAVGNAAVWSEVKGTPNGPRDEFCNVHMSRAGFSWDADYRIAGRPAGAAVHGDLCFRHSVIDGGNYPFTAGPDGGPAWDFAQYVPGSVTLDGSPLPLLP